MANYGANEGGGWSNLANASYGQLQNWGITNLINPGVNPWAPVPESNSSSSSMQTSGGAASGGLPARETSPTLSPFSYSQNATDYPTYLRNLGEQNANRQFESQVNQGIKLGNSVQGYSHAMDNMNNNRLSYMSQAGAADMAVQKQLADENARRNQQMIDLYGMNINQRGQDIGYSASLNRANASGGSGRGYISGMNGTPLPRSGDAARNQVTNYTDIYGDRSYRGPGAYIPMTSGLDLSGGSGWSTYSGDTGDGINSSYSGY